MATHHRDRDTPDTVLLCAHCACVIPETRLCECVCVARVPCAVVFSCTGTSALTSCLAGCFSTKASPALRASDPTLPVWHVTVPTTACVARPWIPSLCSHHVVTGPPLLYRLSAWLFDQLAGASMRSTITLLPPRTRCQSTWTDPTPGPFFHAGGSLVPLESCHPRLSDCQTIMSDGPTGLTGSSRERRPTPTVPPPKDTMVRPVVAPDGTVSHSIFKRSTSPDELLFPMRLHTTQPGGLS